jgi:hypothetical protein
MISPHEAVAGRWVLLCGSLASGTLPSLTDMTSIDTTRPVDMTPVMDETGTLLSTLDRIRRTFAWKCGGLTDEQLRQRLEPSEITLGWLLKHLAFCEDHYFTAVLAGEGYPDVWDRYDLSLEDWDRRTSSEDTASDLMALWEGAVARSRRAIAEAIAADGWDTVAPNPEWGVEANARRYVADMIEEYARHTGHADLIRESIDGLVGEDPRD